MTTQWISEVTEWAESRVQRVQVEYFTTKLYKKGVLKQSLTFQVMCSVKQRAVLSFSTGQPPRLCTHRGTVSLWLTLLASLICRRTQGKSVKTSVGTGKDYYSGLCSHCWRQNPVNQTHRNHPRLLQPGIATQTKHSSIPKHVWACNKNENRVCPLQCFC